MAHPDTIRVLKHQLKIEHYEQGWQWQTDEFCSDDFFPSRPACLANFNHFCTSGELDEIMLAQGETDYDPSADLFRAIKGLEGNIGQGQRFRIEDQVLSEGKGFLRYLELLQQETAPLGH